MKTGTQVQIALLFYTTFNLVVFTAAIYAGTLFPPLVPYAGLVITGFMTVGLIGGLPLAWLVGRSCPADWHKELLARPSPLAHEPGREI
ncbi:hypothetical protein [Undibacter mobilis]|uniref:Uncharacterized protein n=1 Tax=Undibacter mobilis TaxID=2292256 RepID=A0A371B0U9_9BRAD|nr:hypothetical protein [Undibacter mobilis]RDV01103.1 hypothetical protein DXH78_17850 [Undibacter mobilis]